MLLEDIIQDIKKKRGLKYLDDNFIRKRIENYQKKNRLEISDADLNRRNKRYVKFFKDIRKELRIVYGVFRDAREKRSLDAFREIFSLIGDFNSLLDLGCGLNPLDYIKLNKKAEYYCCDVNINEINLVNRYFKKNKICGKAFVFDLVFDDIHKLPDTDAILLFRVLESLEYYERDISERILKNLKCKTIVVSFAKNVLSKKGNIRKKGRSWFRRILGRLNYDYKVYDIGDEIFFVIRK